MTMSTTYLLRKPVKVASLRRLGWRVVLNSEGDKMLTDGRVYAEPFLSDETLFGFERWGQNDVRALARATDAVDEHDEDDPDYARLFAIEEEEED